MRSGDYKLIEHYDPPGVELYNLADDIGEKVDLVSEMPDKAAELRKKIQDWLKESGTIMHTDNPAYRPQGFETREPRSCAGRRHAMRTRVPRRWTI